MARRPERAGAGAGSRPAAPPRSRRAPGARTAPPRRRRSGRRPEPPARAACGAAVLNLARRPRAAPRPSRRAAARARADRRAAHVAGDGGVIGRPRGPRVRPRAARGRRPPFLPLPLSPLSADIISAVEFDADGSHLATGDRGGRVVLFERADARPPPPRDPDSRAPAAATAPAFDYRYLTEFQSHEPEFDYLKSLEIEEKVNRVRWVRSPHAAAAGAGRPPPGPRLLLSTNDKTVKLWKVYDRTVVTLAGFNADSRGKAAGARASAGGGAASWSIAARAGPAARAPAPPSPSKARLGGGGVDARRAPLVLPRVVARETALAARCARSYAGAHAYHVNSLSLCSDGETFLSADDLRVNLWHLDAPAAPPYTLVDLKPPRMEDLTEVVTTAEFHPAHCALFCHASSKGVLRLGDLRAASTCDRPALAMAAPDPPGARSFFSEIIGSISDARWVGGGGGGPRGCPDARRIATRDYMSVTLWDAAAPREPLAVYPVHECLRPRVRGGGGRGVWGRFAGGASNGRRGLARAPTPANRRPTALRPVRERLRLRQVWPRGLRRRRERRDGHLLVPPPRPPRPRRRLPRRRVVRRPPPAGGRAGAPARGVARPAARARGRRGRAAAGARALRAAAAAGRWGCRGVHRDPGRPRRRRPRRGRRRPVEQNAPPGLAPRRARPRGRRLQLALPVPRDRCGVTEGGERGWAERAGSRARAHSAGSAVGEAIESSGARPVAGSGCTGGQRGQCQTGGREAQGVCADRGGALGGRRRAPKLGRRPAARSLPQADVAPEGREARGERRARRGRRRAPVGEGAGQALHGGVQGATVAVEDLWARVETGGGRGGGPRAATRAGRQPPPRDRGRPHPPHQAAARVRVGRPWGRAGRPAPNRRAGRAAANAAPPWSPASPGERPASGQPARRCRSRSIPSRRRAAGARGTRGRPRARGPRTRPPARAAGRRWRPRARSGARSPRRGAWWRGGRGESGARGVWRRLRLDAASPSHLLSLRPVRPSPRARPAPRRPSAVTRPPPPPTPTPNLGADTLARVRSGKPDTPAPP